MTKGDYRRRAEATWFASRSRTLSLYEWVQANPQPRKTKRTQKASGNTSSSRKRKRLLKEVLVKLKDLTTLVQSVLDAE